MSYSNHSWGVAQDISPLLHYTQQEKFNFATHAHIIYSHHLVANICTICKAMNHQLVENECLPVVEIIEL